jgi:glycosyltransferase involved in cell wall biosynthesis
VETVLPLRPQRYPERLGLYVDVSYRVVATPEGRRYSTDRAFLLFACRVGSFFRSLTVLGRAQEAAEHAEYTLPAEVSLFPLPHYESLRRVGAVARGALPALVAFWRGLGQVDKVWVFGPHPLGVALVLLALLRRRKVVLGIRQDTLAYYRARLPSPRWAPALLLVRLLDWAYRLLARRLPATVVGQEVALRYGGPRPSLLAMTVSLVPEAAVARRAPERDWSGRIELLSVGRLEPEKDPLLAVEALATLERRRPGRFRLTWIGRGTLEDAVRERARALGVSGILDLPGYIPFGCGLLQRYRGAHVLLHTALTEGLPQVLLEAQASGLPVVATDVGSVRQALDGGAAGLVVPAGDKDALAEAVLRVVDDPKLRTRLVERGLDLARGRTLESEAARTAAFIAGA